MKKTVCLAVAVGFGACVFAGTTNIVPFFTGFEESEGYTNGMPLTDGTNGWYSTFSDVIVQTNTVKTGLQAVQIPGGSPGGRTLAGAIEAPNYSNVWIQLDVLPAFYESDFPHPVDTNSAAMFYINTSGYFMVHSGPPTPTTNWAIITNDVSGAPITPLVTSQWVRIHAYMDFGGRTWDLYANYVKLRAGITFVNVNFIKFAGLDVFNGSGPTAFVDNVSTKFEQQRHTITADPPSLTNVVFRGLQATNQSFQIFSSTDGDLPLNCSLQPQTNWIGVAPASCLLSDSIPVGVTNSYETYSLAAGTYTSGVLIAGSGGWGVTQLVPVVMHVMEIARSPANIDVSTIAGTDAADETFQVWNAGGGLMEYNIGILDDIPWLSVSPTNNTSAGPGDIKNHTIVFSTSGLSPQQKYYSAIIRITSPDGNASALVNVNLEILDKPKLACSPSVLTNTLVVGYPGICSFDVWRQSGEGVLSYSIVSEAAWASPTPTFGTSTGEKDAITVNIANTLAVGQHSGVLRIYGMEQSSSVEAYNSPQEVEVRITVTPGPALSVSTNILYNQVMQGFDAADQFVRLWNGGGGKLAASVNDDQDWMVTSLTNMSWQGQPNEIQTILIRYSTLNLDPGVYDGTILVYGSDAQYGNPAAGSPATIQVRLTVVPLPVIQCDTAELSDTVRQGQTAPTRAIRIRNSGDIPRGVMQYSVSTSNAWLTITPSSGTSTGEWSQVTVGYDVSTLSPGQWAGEIVVNGTDAITGTEAVNSPITIHVALKLLAANQSDLSGSGRSDLVLYSEATGLWYVMTVEGEVLAWGFKFGGPGFSPFLGDYDGDGTAELCIYSVGGNWHVAKLNENKLIASAVWGGGSMTPVPGDYDGDGKQDFGIYNGFDGTWYIYSSDGRILCWGMPWGGFGMLPSPADYNGDGRCDLAVFDSSSGNWYICDLAGNLFAWGLSWGGAGFAPIRGDFNGDGNFDVGVYDQTYGNWYAITLNGAILFWARNWGGFGFTPICGDFDGDGISDLALYHEQTGYWFITSVDGSVIAWALWWGGPGMIPVGIQ